MVTGELQHGQTLPAGKSSQIPCLAKSSELWSHPTARQTTLHPLSPKSAGTCRGAVPRSPTAPGPGAAPGHRLHPTSGARAGLGDIRGHEGAWGHLGRLRGMLGLQQIHAQTLFPASSQPGAHQTGLNLQNGGGQKISTAPSAAPK